MARDEHNKVYAGPITYAAFADALEHEIVPLRAMTLTATGDHELTERIVAGFLLRVLDREIPRPMTIAPDTIELLYLDYLKEVLESDMVKVAIGNNATVFLSLEQLREAMR
tara:strand:- start:31932 stop:32264 length:333 start_codon:yes stop_codon:yes gene_type:complete